MHLCIFQGFPAFHYEMIGFAIHFCIQNGFTFDVYAHPNELSADWKPFYDELFSLSKPWLKPWELNHSKYDFILLLSDDDFAFEQKWLREYGEKKVICINHHIVYRRYFVRQHVKLRYYENLNTNLYINNCYPVVSYEQKLQIHQKQRDEGFIDVCFLGRANIPLEINLFKKIFPYFDKVRFHIINRDIEPEHKFQNFPNLFYYENCSTKQMVDLLTISSFTICIDHSIYPKNIDRKNKYKRNPTVYRDEICSAVIHLSFCFGCQLILPNQWKRTHKRKSCITYDEKFPFIPIKEPPTAFDLSLVYEERDELIEQRNKVLLSIMFPQLCFHKYFHI
jgi:hypothetical protein